MKSLSEIIDWLESHTNLEKNTKSKKELRKPSLTGLKNFLDSLGNPENCAPCIHITGTNGKGSTSTMIAHLLKASGLKVGLYTSPDLESINERIMIYPDPINNEDLCYLLSLIKELEKTNIGELSRFDILTACAFLYFQDQGVDVMVLEVGLGGRLDSTNVVQAQVCAITNIDLDHTEILGDTLELIAKDKAGIIKENCMPVIGETRRNLQEIFSQAAKEVKANKPLFYGRDFLVTDDKIAHGGHLIEIKTPNQLYPNIFLPLHGSHQTKNAAVALCCCESFFLRSLDENLVADAFSTLTIPGRLEVISRHPIIVLDGAHNPAGAHVLSEAIKNEFFPIDITLVIGMLKDKDADSFIRNLDLWDHIKKIIVCKPNSVRALDVKTLAKKIQDMHPEKTIEMIPDPKFAFEHGLEKAQQTDMVLITGSLYLVGNVRSVAISYLDKSP